jgi:hypothetical protein
MGSFTPLLLYPLNTKLDGLQRRSGLREENFLPYRDSNSDPSIVQPIATHYLDYAILASDESQY